MAVAAIAAFSAITGPVVAVVITLWWQNRRERRARQENVLTTLLITRGRFTDPSFSWAVRATPLVFLGLNDILSAYRDYMASVKVERTEANHLRVDEESNRCMGVLISRMLKHLGYGEFTSESLEIYTASAVTDLDSRYRLALDALPHLAISAKRLADFHEQIAEALHKPDSDVDTPSPST